MVCGSRVHPVNMTLHHLRQSPLAFSLGFLPCFILTSSRRIIFGKSCLHKRATYFYCFSVIINTAPFISQRYMLFTPTIQKLLHINKWHNDSTHLHSPSLILLFSFHITSSLSVCLNSSTCHMSQMGPLTSSVRATVKTLSPSLYYQWPILSFIE